MHEKWSILLVFIGLLLIFMSVNSHIGITLRLVWSFLIKSMITTDIFGIASVYHFNNLTAGFFVSTLVQRAVRNYISQHIFYSVHSSYSVRDECFID